ncbi:MAG: DUF262 domain-containing protein [Sulfurovum sp.]
MGLNLKAEEKSILALFTGDKNQYIIPAYQRPYTWGEKHCEDLFNDLERAFEDENTNEYFLGNIVLASSIEDKHRLEVIDGQQRLTTLTLLIKAFLFFDKNNKKLESSIWELDRRTGEKKEQRLKTMVFQERDAQFLKDALELDLSLDNCIKIKDNNFEKNICYFYTRLDKLEDNKLFDLSDFLLDDVSILPIQTQGNDKNIARRNAIHIFETINTRGISLSTSDILKAKIFAIALSHNNTDTFIKKWNILYKKCESINYTIDNIFEMYKIIIEVQKDIKIKDKKLLDIFLQKDFSPFFYKRDNEIMDDLFKIIDTIIFYKEVSINPSIYAELTKWFQIINEFDIKDIASLVLFNCNLRDDKEMILKVKKVIRYLLIDNDDSDFDIRKNMSNPIKKVNYSNIDDIKSIRNKKALSLLSFYLNPSQKVIYPIYFIGYCDEKDNIAYFKDYFLFRSFTGNNFFSSIIFGNIDIINDSNVNTIYLSDIQGLIIELKKSKIKENNELADKLELSKDEFQKFLKEKEKIEIERIDDFLRDTDEN